MADGHHLENERKITFASIALVLAVLWVLQCADPALLARFLKFNQLNAQFTPPAHQTRQDKTVLSVSSLACRCELALTGIVQLYWLDLRNPVHSRGSAFSTRCSHWQSIWAPFQDIFQLPVCNIFSCKSFIIRSLFRFK